MKQFTINQRPQNQSCRRKTRQEKNVQAKHAIVVSEALYLIILEQNSLQIYPVAHQEKYSSMIVL